MQKLFLCTIVGSYAQPEWLIDKKKLTGRFPPRVRAKELWRIAPSHLQEAQDDATQIAIADQEQAGLDIVSDGEIRRESYSNHFATALEGLDIDNPGEVIGRSGNTTLVPRIVGPIKRSHPVGVRDVEFLKAHTDRQIKMTIPGPFTMSQQAQNEFYETDAQCAHAFAEAVHDEIQDLFAAGADVVQIDEPWMQARPENARKFGIEVLNKALEGIEGKTCVHICFGYPVFVEDHPEAYSFLPELAKSKCHQVSIETAQSNLDCSVLASLPEKEILLGVLNLADPVVESPKIIVERVRRALEFAAPERIVLAPDCGMKYLSRESAFGKLKSMCEAAEQLREEYS